MKISQGAFTHVLNIGGLILGVYWFGWWFLIPGLLTALKITGKNGKPL